MVKLHVKRGDESQFLCETSTETPLSQLLPHLVRLYNGRLKVDRLCQGQLGRCSCTSLVGGIGRCALIRIRWGFSHLTRSSEAASFLCRLPCLLAFLLYTFFYSQPFTLTRSCPFMFKRGGTQSLYIIHECREGREGEGEGLGRREERSRLASRVIFSPSSAKFAQE